MLISKRATNILLLLILVAGVAIVAMLASGARGGPLDPPAAPSATGTLPQVEPRNPIPPVGWDGVSAITIGSAGSYFLTRDLSKIQIIIGAEDVNFDLDGFQLDGTGTASTIDGIAATGGAKRNVVIRDGVVTGWGRQCINLPEVGRSTFQDLHLAGCVGVGLLIGTGNVVSHVDSHDNYRGVEVDQGADYGGTIEQSEFSHNGNQGIYLNGNNVMVRDSVMDTNFSSGVYIGGSWNQVSGSRAVGNNVYGVYLGGNRNVVVRNQLDGNTSGGAFNAASGGGGNIIGPLYPLGSGTDPQANIGF